MILLSLGYVLALFLIAVSVLWVIGRISDYRWKRKIPPEKQEVLLKLFEYRLLHPNWMFYEKHLMRPIPNSLKKASRFD